MNPNEMVTCRIRYKIYPLRFAKFDSYSTPPVRAGTQNIHPNQTHALPSLPLSLSLRVLLLL